MMCMNHELFRLTRLTRIIRKIRRFWRFWWLRSLWWLWRFWWLRFIRSVQFLKLGVLALFPLPALCVLLTSSYVILHVLSIAWTFSIRTV